MGVVTLLQVCPPEVGGMEHLLNFEFIKAFTCTYANVAGLLVVGVLVYGAVASSIYIRTGSVVIPAILVLLTGGAVMGQIAGPAVAIATVVVLTTGAGAFTYLYVRFSR